MECAKPDDRGIQWEACKGVFAIASLKEPYAGVGYANLDWSEQTERAIDRVAAAGKVTKISVWDTAYGLSPAGLERLTRDLLNVAVHRWPRELNCREIVDQAIQEWMFPNCRRCQGSGEVLHDQRYVPCPECEGKKFHLYRDDERSVMMQLSHAKVRQHLNKKIGWCLSWLGKFDRKTNIEMQIELRSEDNS